MSRNRFGAFARRSCAAAAFVLCPLTASAADFDWTGIHIGAHGGYALSTNPGTLTYDPGTGPMPEIWDNADQEFDTSGVFGGVQLGAQRQIGKLVIGVEADYSASAMLDEQTFTTKDGFVDWTIEQQVDFFGTVRGRIGFAMDRLMLYGTGGLAYGHVSGKLAVHQCCLPPDNLTADGRSSEMLMGWTAGAGAEYALTKGVSVKAEWLHIDLGETEGLLKGTNHITDGVHDTDSFPADIAFEVFRLGLNVRF